MSGINVGHTDTVVHAMCLFSAALGSQLPISINQMRCGNVRKGFTFLIIISNSFVHLMICRSFTEHVSIYMQPFRFYFLISNYVMATSPLCCAHNLLGSFYKYVCRLFSFSYCTRGEFLSFDMVYNMLVRWFEFRYAL